MQGKKIKDTTSLCNACYRHIPAEVIEVDNKILITKKCCEHGESFDIIENNKDFYYSLEYNLKNPERSNVVIIEVTDRCNLNCPYCYHIPDNTVTDRSIEDIILEIKSFPPQVLSILLSGAEPTLRKDLVELVLEIQKLGKNVGILTNGVELADDEFINKIKNLKVTFFIGLTPADSVQNPIVYEKQILGIKNCYDNNIFINTISYTCENDIQLNFVIDEMEKYKNMCQAFRIRFGTDIGRFPTPKNKRRTLSDNYNSFINAANKKNLKFERYEEDNNIYHLMVRNGEHKVRLIQWPDVRNIDLSELQHGPWAHFVEGPITNFVHQVIIRDAFKNSKLPVFDMCPEEYHYNQ